MVKARKGGKTRRRGGNRKRRGGTGLLAEIHRALAPYALFQMKKHCALRTFPNEETCTKKEKRRQQNP